MALKFDTSSNYKKTISPPKIFQTLRLLVSLWNKNQNSLSLALTDWSFLSSQHSHWDLQFQRCWPFSHRKIPKIPACTVTKFQNFSLFHQTLLYVGHLRRFCMTMATTRSLQGSHDHHRRCLQAWPSPLFRSLFFRPLKSSYGQASACTATPPFLVMLFTIYTTIGLNITIIHLHHLGLAVTQCSILF